MQRHRFLLIRSPPVKSDLKNPKVVGVGAELSSLKGDKTGARVQKLLQGYAGHVSGLLRQGDELMAVDGVVVSSSSQADKLLSGEPFSRVVLQMQTRFQDTAAQPQSSTLSSFL